MATNEQFVLPIQQKLFAFTSGLTAAEYLEASPTLARLVRQRFAEIRVPVDIQDFFITQPDVFNFALIVSDEAPETAIILPIWMRTAQQSTRFNLRIFSDTDDLTSLAQLVEELDLSEDLADLELPLCFIFDEEWNCQSQWGPHPQAAEPFLDQWFEEHPEYEALADDESPTAQQQFSTALLSFNPTDASLV